MWRFGRCSERQKRKPPFSTTHSHLTPPLQRTPSNIRIKIIFLETRIPGLHFCHRYYGSIFMQILVVAPKCMFVMQQSAQFPSEVISGSTKIVDFDTNRKRVFDFLLVINSNLCCISHVAPFRRYGGLLVENRQFVPTPPSFNALARGDPLRILGWTWYFRNYGATIWWRNHDRRSNHVDTVHECDRQTDGQTDRQNYDNYDRATHSVAR